MTNNELNICCWDDYSFLMVINLIFNAQSISFSKTYLQTTERSNESYCYAVFYKSIHIVEGHAAQLFLGGSEEFWRGLGRPEYMCKFVFVTFGGILYVLLSVLIFSYFLFLYISPYFLYISILYYICYTVLYTLMHFLNFLYISIFYCICFIFL